MSKPFALLLSAVRRQAGFTLIELLIVITILGILAVAVLSALNPIEQINRGRDTGSRSDAEQLLGAIDRYYAFNGYYPWNIGASDPAGADLAWGQFTNTTYPIDSAGCATAGKLSTFSSGTCTGADELKVTFITRVTASTYNPLYVYARGTQGDSVYVCFAPKSKAFLTEANTRCVDTTGSGLPSDIDATTKALICGTPTAAYSCLP